MGNQSNIESLKARIEQIDSQLFSIRENNGRLMRQMADAAAAGSKKKDDKSYPAAEAEFSEYIRANAGRQRDLEVEKARLEATIGVREGRA